ncbi:alkaline phosphatase synthesis sensor protein PhoR [Oxobacter pfennigii]|uniref:histidine kinase n=1 Tax=Oxobacter pfennigii TaxID=36849 RepID=A0A0P8WBI7_9CLOT|nr:HAMP domain-containing sensor histidine kinase [Oxobacter pfennigii]KPU45981.1 alkaline phosphatase synthesis sensor protein PhoR [Oxobacter pfennigii]
MNNYIRQCNEKLQWVIHSIYKFLAFIKHLLQEQFNKNIYTRILFTNVTAFVAGLIAVTMFSTYVVKQVAYDQSQQDLLRKAKRVNYALLQQTGQSWVPAPDEQANNQGQGGQEFLKFLADTFDVKITIYNKEGNIIGTSEDQEVVPGSKVETKFIEILTKGETIITKAQDSETGQPTLIAFVPMGNNMSTIQNGILLETKPSNVELALNKMRLYLIIGGMIILVIFIFISVHLAMYISRPISRLSTTVSEISRGSDVLSVEDQPLDEINILAGQLNKLAVRLQKIQAESSRMEEERARLFGEISHELRTPLTSVQGFVEAIRDGIVQDEALMERYLDTIYIQTLHITRLVDDLLALSRLESGNITVEKLPVNLIALAQGVVMSMEDAAKSRSTSILFEKKTENAVVIGDVDRMEQIIRNLLKNAIRATENGTVRVGVETRQSEIVLSIEDDGIGIASEDLPHIWDRFYRVKNQRENPMQENGSGLGLVIVKKLVQLQGGSIDVASQLGKGTTFSISFPSFDQK